MAVEAHRVNLFSPQLLTNRELMNPIEVNSGHCNNQMGYGIVPSMAETSLLPLYGSVDNVAADSLAPQIIKPAINSVDSSFTYYSNNNSNNINYNLPLPSRKRSRESINNTMVAHPVLQNPRSCAPFSVLGQDISFQIQQQQLEMDQLIVLHIERVKFEIEQKRRRQARTIMEAIERGMMKKLRAKEEEREKIGKLNHALEERVKTLSIQNHIWRNLAQTNEATANALRTNIEQVLAQVKDEHTPGGARLDKEVAAADDAQSCCGSSSAGGGGGGDEGERRRLAWEAKNEGTSRKARGWCPEEGTSRMCRNCGEEESCVLLLPCRHLCLCGLCGSSLHTCPICKSPKNASVHVNMSL